METYREFNEGDRVRVVSEPNRNCPFSWIDLMDEYCGREATIVRKRRDYAYGTYAYVIDIDSNNFSWCGNCFEPLEPEQEEELPDIEGTAFLSAIRMGGGVKSHGRTSSRRSCQVAHKLS